MAKISQTIQIKGKSDKVYKALATEAGVKAWWTIFTKVDEHEGGKAEFHFPDYNVSKYADVKTLEPGRSRVWTR